MDSSSPQPSRSSSRASSRKVNLSLDLSTLPPVAQPTPPSNTLLFTGLNNTDIFLPDNLHTIRHAIAQSAHPAPIHAFSPLKSFRRIIVSFYDVDAAVAVRDTWDAQAIMGDRVRIYFGQPTNVEHNKPELLALPDAGKLFFISPPPSPPHGWEVRLEDAPNKLVHAEDLAEALAKLHHRPTPSSSSLDASRTLGGSCDSPVTPTDGPAAATTTTTNTHTNTSSTTTTTATATATGTGTRSRSSTLIYRPDHSSSPGLPAVFVEDMTDEPESVDMSPLEGNNRPTMLHTARPPVELMQDS